MAITLDKCKSFGQTEKLTKRLKGLMRDYAGDIGIVKELLQNSDDARASKFEIILDEGCYPPDSTEAEIFDQKVFSTIYGPSIIVFDDGNMTKQNVEAIQEISAGNKTEDPCNTGKYGLGFNSVYHIAKTPILVARDAVNIFDSWELLCDWTGRSARPGFSMYAPECKEDFASLLTRLDAVGLPEEKRKDNTIFILPQIDNYIAEIANDKCAESASMFTVEHFQDIVKQVQEYGEELLLFLNHVNHLTIRHINKEGKEVFFLTISRSGDDVIKQQQFIYKSMSQFAKNPLDVPISSMPVICKHDFEIRERGKPSFRRSWNVLRRLFIEKELVQLAQDLKSESAVPLAGAAVLDSTDEALANQGKMYCSLPLPCNSRTCLNIDGRWDLDHSRKNLTKSGNGGDWNKLLIELGASAAVASLISELAMKRGEIAMDLLPKVISEKDNVEDGIPKEIYRHISELPLIPCGQSGVLKSPKDVRCLPDSLRDYRDELISYGLENIPVKPLKRELKTDFRNANCPLKELQPSELRDILRVEKWNDVKIAACPIALLNSLNKVKDLIEFCLDDEDSITELDKLPLALRADGVLTRFDVGHPIWLADEISQPLLDCAADVILNDEISKTIDKFVSHRNGLPLSVPVRSLDHQSLIKLLIDRGIFQKVEDGASIQRSCLKQDDAWLSKFFNYLDVHKSDSRLLTLWLKNIPIIPDRCGNIWPLDHNKIVLIRPSWHYTFRKPLSSSLSTLGVAVIDDIQPELHKSILKCSENFNINVLCPESLVEIIEKLDHKCFQAASGDDISICHVLLDYFSYCFDASGADNVFNVEKLKSLPLFETSDERYISAEESNIYYPGGSKFTAPAIRIDTTAVLKFDPSWQNLFHKLGIQELTIARYTAEVLTSEFQSLTESENKYAWEFLVNNWQEIKSGLDSEYQKEEVESLGEKLVIQCEDAKYHSCNLIHDETLADLKDVFSGAINLPDYDFYKHDKNDFVGLLRMLGMSSKLKPVVVMNAINQIIDSFKTDSLVRQVHVDSIEKIFNYIFYVKPEIIIESFQFKYDDVEYGKLSELLSVIPWLPILDAPPQDSGFPRELMKDNECRLFKIEEIYLQKHWESMISTGAVLAFNVKEITKELKDLGFNEGIGCDVSKLSDVASHLINLVTYCDGGRLPAEDLEANAIKRCLSNCYRTLGENLPSKEVLAQNSHWKQFEGPLQCLRDSNSIFDGNENFHHPSKVVLKTHAGLAPWLKVININDESIEKCFSVFGSKPAPEPEDAKAILCEMREKYGDQAVGKQDHLVAQNAFCIIGKTKGNQASFPNMSGVDFAVDHNANFSEPGKLLVNDSEKREKRLSGSASWFLGETWTQKWEKSCNGFGITRSHDLLERCDASTFSKDESPSGISSLEKLKKQLCSDELLTSIERLIFHHTGEIFEPVRKEELSDILNNLQVHPSKGKFYTSLFWPGNEAEIKNTRGETSSCIEGNSLYIDLDASMSELILAKWIVENIENNHSCIDNVQAMTPEIRELMSIPLYKFSSALSELDIKTHPEQVQIELDEESDIVDYCVPDDHSSKLGDASVDETVAVEKGAASDIEVKESNASEFSTSKQEVDSDVDHDPKIPIDVDGIAGNELPKKETPGEERSNTSRTNTDAKETSKVSQGHADSKGSHKRERSISPGSAKTYHGPQQQKPVYVGNPNRTQSEGSSKAVSVRNKETEVAAVNAALKNEKDKGRYAIDANEARSNNKGYDIESWDMEPKDKNNPPEPDRYIEVKGTKNPWKERGVGVTTAQHRCGIEKGSKFWLYVVEKASQPEQKLHEIQNPVGQITEYMFNGSWAQLAQQERSIPELGKTAYDSASDKVIGRITQVRRMGNGKYKWSCDDEDESRAWRSTYICQ
jgi:hypothetical protein